MSNVGYGRGSGGINIVIWLQVGWWFDCGNHPDFVPSLGTVSDTWELQGVAGSPETWGYDLGLGRIGDACGPSLLSVLPLGISTTGHSSDGMLWGMLTVCHGLERCVMTRVVALASFGLCLRPWRYV